MKYIIKCETCGKEIGFTENPAQPERAVKGYQCGTLQEPSSCASKWWAHLSEAERQARNKEQDEKKKQMIALIKEMKAKKQI